MFGGALVGGTIAKEHLYHLKVKDNKALWSEVTVKGEKPLPRYGHTLSSVSYTHLTLPTIYSV